MSKKPESQNKLTVYSNGITRIRRVVTINGRTIISIPVKKDCVGDVLATFKVYGNVNIVEALSYNNDATKNALRLNAANISFDLATKLSGADVEILAQGKKYIGKLAGVQIKETVQLGAITKAYEIIIINTDGEVIGIDDVSIATMKFLQPEVQRLIQNALAKNFETVRPDSVLMKVVIEPSGAGVVIYPGIGTQDALLDYAFPTAAWQSIYQLQVGDKKSTLEYNAKVDNPTDEDWISSKVSVVVGEPITVKTTLGEVRLPQRAELDLVAKKTVGPVRKRDVVMNFSAKSPGMKSVRAASMESNEDLEELRALSDVQYCGVIAAPAQTTQSTAEEVGDFAVFTSEDTIDIRANLSGVVRLFTEEIEAKEILFYNQAEDKERAYRGVRVKNTTSHTLGGGICTVYLGDTLAGQDEFKMCKPYDSITLVFARENGVKVFCKPGDIKTSRTSIGMSSGQLWWMERSTFETLYTISNGYDGTAFEVEIDHSTRFGNDSTTVETTSGTPVTVDNTKDGLKIKGQLPANGVLAFSTTEIMNRKTEWQIQGASGFGRLASFLSSDETAGSKVRSTDGYKMVEKLMEEHNSLELKVTQLEEEAERLEKEQTRLLSLVKAGSSASQLSKWQGSLDKGEDRISSIEKSLLPATNKALEDKDKQITEALKNFVIAWESKGVK